MKRVISPKLSYRHEPIPLGQYPEDDPLFGIFAIVIGNDTLGFFTGMNLRDAQKQCDIHKNELDAIAGDNSWNVVSVKYHMDKFQDDLDMLVFGSLNALLDEYLLVD